MIDTIIIGGGAAGSFLSSLIPSAHLFEKTNILCSKLLITGNGACNVTHSEDIKSFITHYYDKKNFISPSIYAFGPERIREYLKAKGVETYIREDGKVFPTSNNANDIKNALVKDLKNIHLNEEVVSIEKKDNYFIVKTNKQSYEAKVVVCATGGASYPLTGSDGSFFTILKSLGHKIIPLRPALSALITDSINTQKLEGITLNNVTLTHKKKKYTGPILFTKRGITGPMVMNMSRFVENNDEVILTFANLDKEEIKNQNGKTKCINAIHDLTLLPKSFLEVVLSCSEKKVAELSKKDIQEIMENITSLKLNVKLDKLNLATVTKGGVDTTEIDKTTYKSKLVDNLYIIGECTDVDGECGGYNLTYAFSSAYCAYLSISNHQI